MAWRWSLRAIQVATAAGLAIDADVHPDLASLYAEASGSINEGMLFRAEAVTALLAATAVIAVGRRACYLAALAVAATVLARDAGGAVREYRADRPVPYPVRPRLVPEKLLAAFAKGVAIGTALAGAIIASRAGKTRRGDGPPQP